MAKVEYPPEVQKKLKRILKPVLSVIGGRQYKPCGLCGIETSWTINNHPVCPLCSIKYGFLTKAYDYGPCEICSRQGEWLCGKDDQHSLCCRHRDAWFDWTKEPFLLRGYHNLPEEEKDIAWEKGFALFIQEVKNGR